MQPSSCKRIILFSPYRLKPCAQVEIFSWKNLSLSWPGHSQWSPGDNRQFSPCMDMQHTLESNSSPSNPSFAICGEQISYSFFFPVMN